MKTVILACLLATSAASAFAEWTKVTESDEANFYIDLSTLRQDGSFRKVWTVQDSKSLKELSVKSLRMYYEYDCKEERVKILAISTHSESMLGGEILFTGGADPSGWRAIPPATALETMLKTVCAK